MSRVALDVYSLKPSTKANTSLRRRNNVEMPPCYTFILLFYRYFSYPWTLD